MPPAFVDKPGNATESDKMRKIEKKNLARSTHTLLSFMIFLFQTDFETNVNNMGLKTTLAHFMPNPRALSLRIPKELDLHQFWALAFGYFQRIRLGI